MASTYLFFRPLRLPLSPDELGDATLAPLTCDDPIRAALEGIVPGVAGPADGPFHGEVDGHRVEFHIPADEGTLSMRCSLRTDCSAIVQRLCDTLGWVAFDEQPLCYQPGRAPMPA